MTLGVQTYAFFFFNDTATTEIYTLSLHDALPIWSAARGRVPAQGGRCRHRRSWRPASPLVRPRASSARSEEHTSELQSLRHLVCRLLLEKKKIERAVRTPGDPAQVQRARTFALAP